MASWKAARRKLRSKRHQEEASRHHKNPQAVSLLYRDHQGVLLRVVLLGCCYERLNDLHELNCHNHREMVRSTWISLRHFFSIVHHVCHRNIDPGAGELIIIVSSSVVACFFLEWKAFESRHRFPLEFTESSRKENLLDVLGESSTVERV